MKFLVNAGHDEYPLNLPDSNMQLIWDAGSDELLEQVVTLSESDMAAEFLRQTGHVAGDWDLSWARVYLIDAEEADVEVALTQLIEAISAIPSGDDDVFDYWPSGVRLAFEVAEELGGLWSRRVAAVARQISAFSGYEDELLAKIGLEKRPNHTIEVREGVIYLDGTLCEDMVVVDSVGAVFDHIDGLTEEADEEPHAAP